MLLRYPWGLGIWSLGLILLLLYFLPLIFHFGDSPGNTTLYLMAALIDSGLGGLFRLIDRLSGGAAVTGLLSDRASAPLLLGQLLFQLGRHDTAAPLLDRLAALALTLIFDLVTLAAFFYFSYSIASPKIAGAPRRGVRPNKLSV